MILQALYEFYQQNQNDLQLSPYGFKEQNINFTIVIRPDGTVIEECLIQTKEKLELPTSRKHSSDTGMSAVNIFWGNQEYVLGIDKQKKSSKNKNQASVFLNQFKELCTHLSKEFPENKEFEAVANFYRNPKNIKQVIQKIEENPTKKDSFLTFKILGSDYVVSERFNPHFQSISDKVFEETTKYTSPIEIPRKFCLITGKTDTLTKRIHGPIALPGSKDKQTKMVSFNNDSACSYNKEQGDNAPISEQAEHAYTTALNYLLNEEHHHFNFNKSGPNGKNEGHSYIFWFNDKAIDKANSIDVWSLNTEKNNSKEVKKVFESLYKQNKPFTKEKYFYLLGLSRASQGTVAVSYWQKTTVTQLAANICQYFDDIALSTNDKEASFHIFQFLQALSEPNKKNGKFELSLNNTQKEIITTSINVIFNGLPFKAYIQQQCLHRIKSEQTFDENVSSTRAAILKAFLNRKYRNNLLVKPITMALDKTNTNPGYLCGRLFAVLEKVQTDSARIQNDKKKLNTTIKDSCYTAASVTPVVVFSRLISLNNHHLAKFESGLKSYYERILDEIFDKIETNGLPRQLNLDDQCRFAIGYFHQRTDLWTSKKGIDPAEIPVKNEESDNQF